MRGFDVFNGILRRFHVDFLAFPRDFGGVSRVCDDIFRAFCVKFSGFSVHFCGGLHLTMGLIEGQIDLQKYGENPMRIVNNPTF